MPNRLIQIRKRFKFTQEETAKRLDVNRTTYTNYEIGKRIPEPETLEKIADLFEVSIDYLFGRNDELADYELTNPNHLRRVRCCVDGMPITEVQARMVANFIRADRVTNK